MADTISQYKGRGQGQPRLRAPSEGGVVMANAATKRYLDGLDAFFNAGNKLALRYFEAIENRERRDANTYCNNLFRERRVEILNTTKGKDVDGLLEREDKWQQEEYKKFLDEFDIETAAGKQMWQQHASRYLDSTGSYMLAQQAAYDEQSRLAASDSEIDGLVDTKVGDIVALNAVFTKNEELFKDKPMRAEQQNDKAIATLVGAWARQNPGATTRWWKANKEALKQEWGQKWNSAADMVEKAENKLRAEAAHAEVMAARAQRIQIQKEKEYSEGVRNEFVTKLYKGEASSADVYAVIDDPRVRASDKEGIISLVRGLEEAERKAQDRETQASQAITESSVLQTYVIEGPERGRASMEDAIASGELTAEQANRIAAFGTKLQSIDASAKPVVDSAYTYVDDIYGGQVGMTGIKDPRRLEQVAQLKAAMAQRLKESPQTAAKDFNINDEASWFRQMVKMNQPLPGDLTQSVPGLQTFAPFSTEIKPLGTVKPIPSGTEQSQPSEQKSSSGNSLIDKMERQGVKPENK